MERGKNRFRGRGYAFYKFRGRGSGAKSQHRKSSNNTPTQPVRKKVQVPLTELNCKYHGWKVYHPDEGYIENSNTVQKVRTIESYITNNLHLFSMDAIEETHAFPIDLKLLYDDINVTASWKELASDLVNLPEHTISCIGLGMHQILVNKLTEEVKGDVPYGQDGTETINLPMIRARVVNYEPVLQLKNLKSNYFGKLVGVKGTIIRVGNIKLACTWMAFECTSCSSLQCVKQPEGIYTLPSTCISDGCRSRNFSPLLSSPCTQTVNWQGVRLQEIVADEQREGGRVPRTTECELTADLVDTCSPGDVVTITGIVKIRNSEEGAKKKTKSVFSTYIDVVSVINNKNQSGGGRNPVEFNIKDYYAIKEIHAEKQLLKLIVNSLCPSIYGHEVVKAGLILCMFGGCQRHQDSRADPHILIVGDPGLGKSRMLQACANMTPRGVYVCGNTSTASGLTVTLHREGGGDYALEAGALVLSDQGSCCIDEFDKMSTQHQALLEAMEQQTISIAKAGVVCSLPARTSILAAANPIGGHYNKAKTVSENLKIGPALLSRFDLVFILLDLPNEKLDRMLSEHVMGLHSGLSFTNTMSSMCSSAVSDPGNFKGRLQLNPGEEVDLVPHELLRKYIAYARKYVRPRLSREAASVLQKFYLELRQIHQSADLTPVTTRQLESLIRLTEARAKLELREEATQQDAWDVIELFKYSMVDTFADETGTLDFSRSLHGSGMSSRNQAKRFISILQKRAELQCRSVFTVQELKEVAKNASIHLTDFNSFLSTLNVQGFLLKKGSQLYQLLSTDY